LIPTEAATETATEDWNGSAGNAADRRNPLGWHFRSQIFIQEDEDAGARAKGDRLLPPVDDGVIAGKESEVGIIYQSSQNRVHLFRLWGVL